MPLFRITKKLAAVLQMKLPATSLEHDNAEHEWFADFFFVGGKKCVIWVHRPTLLTFARPAVVAAELREFHALFRYEFRTAIASMALPESLLERFDVYGEARYATTNDRRVVGSMLDYRNLFEGYFSADGGLERADVRGVNALLNEAPMSVLGMSSAVDVVRSLVGPASAMVH